MAMMSLQVDAVDIPIFLARVLSPSFVLLIGLTLFFAKPTPPRSPSEITPVVVANPVPRRAVILSLLSLAALSYFLDGLAFVVFAILDHDWPKHTGIPINTITGLIAFSGLAALGTWKDIHGLHVWLFRRIKIAVAFSLAADISLTLFLASSLRDGNPSHVFTIRALVHVVFPAFRVLVLLPLFGALSSPRIIYTPTQAYRDVEEPIPSVSSFLLPHDRVPHSSTGLNTGSINSESSKYGTFRVTRSNLLPSVPVTRAPTPAVTRAPTPVQSTAPGVKVDTKSEISYNPSWSELWKRLRRLTPYLWPKHSPSLQFLAFLCILVLLLGRAVNLAMPLTLGKVVSILEGKTKQSLWPYLFGYVCLRFLQGSGGLEVVRACLWAPVMQYSDREMSQLSFDHLLNLSFAWHTRRKTGEILRVLDRGAAINHTLELILFNIVPTFIDILIALVAFCIIFKWTLGLVLFFVMFAYVSASVILTRWRTQLKRQMNERDIVTRGIHTDCLLNYETVKYFNGERHEGERYAEALREYQELEYKVITSLNLLNLIQNFIITLGLLVGSLMVAHEIISGSSDSSQFVIFITYLAQLYGPLNQLGTIYRSINTSLVDTEKLLALLNEPTEVNDKPNAPDLVVQNGEIEFENVHFSYDGRSSALTGVSFKVPKGSSVALVGESGSGKSTILRLLYRFYDLREGEGRILIDGQDIRDITQRSLRQAIGVVPQESILFNSSIAYNIGYGKFGSTPDEVEAAARSAQMHDRIMSFPDGYNTKVGERGVRLSGGEKQRVAIARTLLKNPPILLLDEATSALDTSTEKDIQKALQILVQGRSSVSIAHRLSTIASSDIILVLKDGQIAEQGNFKELIEIEDGVFASMWADQVTSSDDHATGSVKKRVSGYSVGTVDRTSKNVEGPEGIVAEDINLAPDFSEVVQRGPDGPAGDTLPVSEVTMEESKVVDEPESTEPSAVPATVFMFPTSAEPSEIVEPIPVSAPSVTFGSSVNSPPSRSGTPDPESDPKRKRISSQNFQRLARRLSLTTRRQGSSSSIISGIPGLGKRDSSPKVSVDDASRGEASTARNSTDSPAGSLKGDDKSKLLKWKEKKTRKGSIG
jgi:ABC-type transport system involved in Fe-S cluster assembly fused permease/ATPase subunit